MTEHPSDDFVASRISRRVALRSWLAGAVPLLLLTACAGPTAAQTTNVPARSGQTGAAQAVARQDTSLPACVLTPRQTEGPYFVDERLNRSDIRGNPADGAVSEGVPLNLTLHVSQVDGEACTPLAGLFVDLWQCDAYGIYSDVNDRSTRSSVGEQFLRGYQVTDEQGVARFTTIYPGFYRGRTVHIHFKVRTALDGGREQVSQFYFDDALSDEVFKQAPYNTMGTRTTRNANDGIYRAGGDRLTLQCVPDGEGYAATYHLGVQLS
jgi:protocatechuate 3,4-dioxygenase beta subunit